MHDSSRTWSRVGLPALFLAVLAATGCRILPTFFYSDSPPERSQGAAAPAASGAAGRLGGTWLGEVTNAATNRDATVEMELSQAGRSLTGDLTIGPPLLGSGDVEGRVHGDRVRLRSKGEGNDAFVIDWYGAVDDGSIEGTYKVINTRPVQHGRWKVEKD